MITSRKRSQSQQREANNTTKTDSEASGEDPQAIARQVLLDLEGFLDDTDTHSVASDDESEGSVVERGRRIPLTMEELTLVVDTSIQRHRQPISALDHHEKIEPVASEEDSEEENSDEEDSDDEASEEKCTTPIAEFQRLLAQKSKAFRQQQQENRQVFTRTGNQEKHSRSIWSLDSSPGSALSDRGANGSLSMSSPPDIDHQQQTQPLHEVGVQAIDSPSIACNHECCSSKTREFSQQTMIMRTKDQATHTDTHGSPAKSDNPSNQMESKQTASLKTLVTSTAVDIGVQLSPPVSARSAKVPTPVLSDVEVQHSPRNYRFKPREPREPPLRAQSLAASSCPSLRSSISSLSLSGVRSFASDPTHSRVSSARSRRHSSRRQSSKDATTTTSKSLRLSSHPSNEPKAQSQRPPEWELDLSNFTP